MRPWVRDILEDIGAVGLEATWQGRQARILLRRDSMNGGRPHLLRSCSPERIGPELLGLSDAGRFYATEEGEVTILPGKQVTVSGGAGRVYCMFCEVDPHPGVPGLPTGLRDGEWRDLPGHYRQGRIGNVGLVLGPDATFPPPELLVLCRAG